MHVFLRNWAPWLVPDLQKPLDEALVSPWAKLVLIGYLALSVAGGTGIALLFWEGVSVRDQQRWAAEREAQQRLSAMERQIRRIFPPVLSRFPHVTL